MMKKLKEHINRWDRWRRNSMSGKLHKLLVLLGVRKEISMMERDM